MPSHESQLAQLQAALDEARRRFAEDAASRATDEPTRHFADRVLSHFETLALALRRYRYARELRGDPPG